MVYDFYEVLRDLAGPGATIIASCVAAVVAIRFGNLQAALARQQAATTAQQAELADLRLKHDLYERRFAVYSAARTLLGHILTSPAPDAEALVKYSTETSDAVFFGFDQNLIDYLQHLSVEGYRLKELRDVLDADTTLLNADAPTLAGAAKEVVDLLNWFRAQFPVVVEKFKPFLMLVPEVRR